MKGFAGIDRGIDQLPRRPSVYVPFDEQAIECAKSAHFDQVAEGVLGPIDIEVLTNGMLRQLLRNEGDR